MINDGIIFNSGRDGWTPPRAPRLFEPLPKQPETMDGQPASARAPSGPGPSGGPAPAKKLEFLRVSHDAKRVRLVSDSVRYWMVFSPIVCRVASPEDAAHRIKGRTGLSVAPCLRHARWVIDRGDGRLKIMAVGNSAQARISEWVRETLRAPWSPQAPDWGIALERDGPHGRLGVKMAPLTTPLEGPPSRADDHTGFVRAKIDEYVAAALDEEKRTGRAVLSAMTFDRWRQGKDVALSLLADLCLPESDEEIDRKLARL